MRKTCCCGCSQRKKERTPEEYKRLIHVAQPHRARSAASRHGRKRRLLPDILVQSAAAGAALNAFNKGGAAGQHIRTRVVEDIRDGKDEVIDELVATLQKLMK